MDKNGVFTPETCYRYRVNESVYDVRDNDLDPVCPRNLFDDQLKERCFEWIFDAEERTIVQEVCIVYDSNTMGQNRNIF